MLDPRHRKLFTCPHELKQVSGNLWHVVFRHFMLLQWRGLVLPTPGDEHTCSVYGWMGTGFAYIGKAARKRGQA